MAISLEVIGASDAAFDFVRNDREDDLQQGSLATPHNGTRALVAAFATVLLLGILQLGGMQNRWQSSIQIGNGCRTSWRNSVQHRDITTAPYPFAQACCRLR